MKNDQKMQDEEQLAALALLWPARNVIHAPKKAKRQARRADGSSAASYGLLVMV